MDTRFIVATVQAAHRVGATQTERAAEVQLVDQLRSADIFAARDAGMQLAQPTQPLEAQILGFAVLQHIVGNRWDEIPSSQHSSLADAGYALLQQSCASGSLWSVRSKAALLLALIVKRSGPATVHGAISQLLDRAGADPAAQEVACMVFQYLADELVQSTDDVAADQLRQMVAALTNVLPAVLRFIERVIEENFAALERQHQGDSNRRIYVAALNAGLTATLSFAEWAAVGALRDAGLIVASGYLLRSEKFRDAACRVLMKVATRKMTADESPDIFATGMREAAEALLTTADALLAPGSLQSLDYEGENDEFGQHVCEALALLGTGHLSQAVPDPSRRLTYLQCMLAFAQQPYLPLADKALALWAKLLQDGAAAAEANAATVTGEPPKVAPLPPEGVLTLMKLAAEHLQQRNPHVPQAEDDIPPYFIDFQEYKEFMISYRLKLSNIVKAAAVVLPVEALEAAASRLGEATAAASGVNQPGAAVSVGSARILLESAVLFTESACRAVWDSPAAASNPRICAITEQILGTLLALRTTDTQLLISQARGLEAFARLLAVRSDLIVPVVDRLFELLTGCIPLEAGGNVAPPSKPAPGWREGLQARSSVAIVFLEYAKAAPAAFLPHLEMIAVRLKGLWEAGQLRPGERNAVNEALLAAAARAGSLSLQQSLADWALAPVQAVWTDATWQASLATPEAFIAKYIQVGSSSEPLQAAPATPPVFVGGGPARWTLYHEVHMIERAVRRMHATSSQSSGGTAQHALPHPLTRHMAWALPILLQVTACANAMYSPAGRAALGAAVGALDMAPQEKALYLRRGPATGRFATKAMPDMSTEDTGEYASVGSATTSSLRAWLRHLREFACHTLGLLPTHVPDALDLPDLSTIIAPRALAYVDSLSHQHVRLILRHITIPHVKSVPGRHVVAWVLPQLAVLTPHMQMRLRGAWERLLPLVAASKGLETGEESQAVGMGAGDAGGGGAAMREIIEEAMVRELTQEYADLLKEIAHRVIDLDASRKGSVAEGKEEASKKSSASHAGEGPTLLQLLLEREPATGIAAAIAAVEGMTLPDEAAYRFAMFSRALVPLAVQDRQLYHYVGSDVLRSAIMSLASEVMATHQADVLGLIRQILAQQLGDASSAVHAVLRSLPGVTSEREAEFARAFQSTGSEKEQRGAVKKLLVASCGTTSFAALADWRPPTAVPTGVARQRSGPAKMVSSTATDDQDEQLQGDITRALFE